MPASSAASSALSRPISPRRPSEAAAGGAKTSAWPAVLMPLLNLAGGADGLIGLGESHQRIGVGDLRPAARGSLHRQAAALAHGLDHRPVRIAVLGPGAVLLQDREGEALLADGERDIAVGLQLIARDIAHLVAHPRLGCMGDGDEGVAAALEVPRLLLRRAGGVAEGL